MTTTTTTSSQTSVAELKNVFLHYFNDGDTVVDTGYGGVCDLVAAFACCTPALHYSEWCKECTTAMLKKSLQVEDFDMWIDLLESQPDFSRLSCVDIALKFDAPEALMVISRLRIQKHYFTQYELNIAEDENSTKCVKYLTRCLKRVRYHF